MDAENKNKSAPVIENKSVEVKNTIADFLNSDDNKENKLHENASAASVNDGVPSGTPDFKNDNKELDKNKSKSKKSEKLNLEDIPKKYWKHHTV